MRIFVMSDPHGDRRFVKQVADVLKTVDIVVLCGDLARSGRVDSAVKLIDEIRYHVPVILSVHGNWDGKEVIDMLNEQGLNLHAESRLINGIGFFGVGGSTPTPMHTVSEYEEVEIDYFLEQGFSGVAVAPVKVLVTHAPPWQACDRAFGGHRAGSRAIRAFLERKQPTLCLCGHIHEARGVDFIGKCLVVNPGTFRRGRYVVVEIEQDGGIKLEGLPYRVS